MEKGASCSGRVRSIHGDWGLERYSMPPRNSNEHTTCRRIQIVGPARFLGQSAAHCLRPRADALAEDDAGRAADEKRRRVGLQVAESVSTYGGATVTTGPACQRNHVGGVHVPGPRTHRSCPLA